MKLTVTLTEADLKEAVAALLKQKFDDAEVTNVHLSASATYDRMDRPTGGHTISAKADIDQTPKES